MVPEEEGIIDDVSEEEIGVTDEILQEMTLEKFEHVCRTQAGSRSTN